jgi:sec-independent protein translocase protein TatA
VLLVFGAARLPQIGEALGKAIRNFRRGASGEGEKDKTDNINKADIGTDRDSSKT